MQRNIFINKIVKKSKKYFKKKKVVKGEPRSKLELVELLRELNVKRNTDSRSTLVKKLEIAMEITNS
jgi:hypothetical protein